MKTKILLPIIFWFWAICIFSEEIPVLSFSGMSGYPSDSPYKIDIYTDSQGIISRMVSYKGKNFQKNEEMQVMLNAHNISGSLVSENYKTGFSIQLDNNNILIVLTGEEATSKKKTKWQKKIEIISQNPLVFVDDDRRIEFDRKGEFKEIDIQTNDLIYESKKNQIINDGYYKSDWKRRGNETAVKDFLTMEKDGEWINSDSGVYRGVFPVSHDVKKMILNYSIIGISYPHVPDFIPFIFGLKTGTY
jgi:hypothetical protein